MLVPKLQTLAVTKSPTVTLLGTPAPDAAFASHSVAAPNVLPVLYFKKEPEAYVNALVFTKPPARMSKDPPLAMVVAPDAKGVNLLRILMLPAIDSALPVMASSPPESKTVADVVVKAPEPDVLMVVPRPLDVAAFPHVMV